MDADAVGMSSWGEDQLNSLLTESVWFGGVGRKEGLGGSWEGIVGVSELGRYKHLTEHESGRHVASWGYRGSLRSEVNNWRHFPHLPSRSVLARQICFAGYSELRNININNINIGECNNYWSWAGGTWRVHQGLVGDNGKLWYYRIECPGECPMQGFIFIRTRTTLLLRK